MGRAVLLAAIALAALVTVPPVEAETRAVPPGPLLIGAGNLTVEAGDTLVLQGPTVVRGEGRILVRGNLLILGRPDATVNVSVPIQFEGQGASRIEHTRLMLVNGTAITLASGSLEVRDSLFLANGRAIRANGTSRLALSNVTLQDHVGEALYVQDAAEVRVANATFRGNGRGATVYSAGLLDVSDSRFLDNGEHLVVDLSPWSAPAQSMRFSRNEFLALAPSGAQLPALLLRYDAAVSADAPPRVVELDANRFLGGPIGLRAEGRGLVVEGRFDQFLDNAVGLSVQLATVHLVSPTLANERDVDGAGRVTLEDARYVRGTSAATTDPAAGAPRVGMGIAAAVALALLGVGLVLALRRRRASPRAPARAPQPTAPPPREPATDAPPAAEARAAEGLTAAERRVLADVAAHPGTPQRAVADRLGATRQAIHYHVKKLEARGFLVKRVEGRETQLTLAPGVALATNATTPTESQQKQ